MLPRSGGALPRVLHWATVLALCAAFSAWFVCRQTAAVGTAFAHLVPFQEYLASGVDTFLVMGALYLAMPLCRPEPPGRFPIPKVAGFAVSVALAVFSSLLAGVVAYTAFAAAFWLRGKSHIPRGEFRRLLVEYAVPFVVIAAGFTIVLPSVSPLYAYHAASRAYETYQSSAGLAIRNYVAAHYFSFSAFSHTFWGMIQDPAAPLTSLLVASVGVLDVFSLWEASAFFKLMSLIYFSLYVFAAYFVFLMLREFGVRWSVALASAMILIAGNRFYLNLVIQDMGWIGASVAALTASLWLLVVAQRQDSFVVGAWSGLALAAQFYILAPHPEMVIYGVVMYIVVALSFVMIQQASNRLRAFSICVGSGVVFTLVSLAHLVPIVSQLVTGSTIVHGEATTVPESYAFDAPGLTFYALLLGTCAVLEVWRWRRDGNVRPALVGFLLIAVPILGLAIPGVPTRVHDFFAVYLNWTVHLWPPDRLLSYFTFSTLIIAALGVDAALRLIPVPRMRHFMVRLVKEHQPLRGSVQVNVAVVAALAFVLSIPWMAGSRTSITVLEASLQGVRESIQAVLANSLGERDRQSSIPFLRARLVEFEDRSVSWDIPMLPAVRREYDAVLAAYGAKSARDLSFAKVRDVASAMAPRIDAAYGSVNWLDDIPENVDRYLHGLDDPYIRVMAVVGAHDLDKQLQQKAFLTVARNVANAHNNTLIMDTRAYIGYPSIQALYIYPRDFLANYRPVVHFGGSYAVASERPPWHYETKDVIGNEFRKILGIGGVGAYLMLPESEVLEALDRPGSNLKRLSRTEDGKETMVLVRDLDAYDTAYLARVVATVAPERIEKLAAASRMFFSQRMDLGTFRAELDPLANTLLGMPKRHDAIVEEVGDRLALDEAKKAGMQAEGPAARGGKVEIEGVIGPRVGLKVQCPDPQCVVVYNLAALPGWRAYVDNEQSLISRANYGFISVMVPKGSHYVSLFYETPGQTIAEWASLLTVIGMLGLARRNRSVPGRP